MLSLPQCVNPSLDHRVQSHFYTVLLCTTWSRVQFNTLRLRQNGCHFPDNIFKCVFLNEKVRILVEISLKFVPKGPINNIPALVQIMAWCWPGDKPLFDPMMIILLTHICVTRPQWVNEHTRSGGSLKWLNKFLPFLHSGVPGAQLWWHQSNQWFGARLK